MTVLQILAEHRLLIEELAFEDVKLHKPETVMVIRDGVQQSCLRNSIQLAKRQCQNQQVTGQLLLTLSPFTLAEWTVPLTYFPTDFKLQNGPGPQMIPALFGHFFFSEKGK